jgi:hypothetical protein
MQEQLSHNIGRRHLAWGIVFALNSIIPLCFGLDVTRSGGRMGMMAATVALWLLGHILCARSADAASVLVGGGSCLAMTQVVPIVHLMAGRIALRLCGVSILGETGPIGEIRSFIVTMVTGLQLAMVACALGYPLWLYRKHRAPDHNCPLRGPN